MPNPPEFVPPPPPPPPVIMSPPAPQPRRGRGLMIAAIIFLLLLLGLSLIGNLTQFVANAFSGRRGLRTEAFSSVRDVGPKLDEWMLANNHSANKIAVITVDGIITSHEADEGGNNMVDVIKAQLDRAGEDRRVKAVILKVDSPGGEVLASDDIYKAIRDFETENSGEHGKPAHAAKPVICSMGSLAASGGYYISSGCRWIVANDLTLTASIGVIMHGMNYRGLMDKVGVAPMTFKSGKYKDMLSGERETNEIPAGEHEMVQNLIMETYGQFTNVVSKGRGTAHDLNKMEGKQLANNWMDFADGRVVSGKGALDLGLVDELGDFDTAVDRAQKIADITDCNLVEYRERYDISNFLSMFGQGSQSKDIKLQLDTEAPKLHEGLMYFLYQP
ncbi:MAG TPA: signal peptide peptidase SppA [Verrucomicrobiae bacterium]|nr:signal peptide peptidase SppA [Verrucomicrobiae bacterium]